MDRISTSSTTFFNKLKSAIQNHKITPHYQPVVNLSNGNVSSFEVLARWKDENYGAISPGDFIPVAESAKLIRTLTESILDQLINDLPRIKATFIHAKFAINISPSLFAANQLLQIFNDRSAISGRHFHDIDLEIIENEMLENENETNDQIFELNKMGLNITIDDYGKSYSSLARLVQLPFNRLKIDQSFVKDLGIRREAEIIIRNIIDLANKLDIKVIAEGVENSQQREMLTDFGCDYAQGWLFSAALPFDEIHQLPVKFDL